MLLSTGGATRNIVGIAGNAFSFLLFLSPVPTFYKICRRKEVGDFSPVPYLATLLSCMMWAFYGTPLVHPHSLLLVTTNGVGVLLEAGYLAIFATYATSSGRSRLFKVLVAELVFMAGVVAAVLAWAPTHEERSPVVGFLCVVFGTCMYASALAAMRNVVRTRSVEYMPLPLSLASFLNGACWTAYALLGSDVFVAVPNVLGTLLGFLQLAVYGYYSPIAHREEYGPELRLPMVGEGVILR